MLVNPLMEEIRRKTPPEIKKQVDMQVMIANRVYDLLEAKGMSQKDFAAKLGKTETEVSRWLCGTHNLTMATIAKMAVALEDDLIVSTQSKPSKHKFSITSKRVAAVL
ncbi:MAG: helix-turn-helix transcriptional regulator [Bacteroidales bacterium]|nr:helix-turn-helix transcriptional regulator [Candidatus Colicola equi]